MKTGLLVIAAMFAMAVPAHASDGSWIQSSQLASGAIPIHPSGTSRRVLPYDANLAARGMLAESASYCTATQKWMQWYINHLNWPDKYGLYGSVYDYTVNVSTGVETSLVNYDSADSYSATFMSLAKDGAVACPAIKTWLQTNKYAVNAVGHVMTDPKILAPDGLTWAKPDYRARFNMDNSEVYAGMTDAAWVATNVWSDSAEAGWYSSHAATLLSHYDAALWLSAQSAYSPAVAENNVKDPWSLDRWFPDGTTQVYPIAYGVIAYNSARATTIWNRLNTRWPSWTGCQMVGPTGQQEPFSEIGYASAIRGDMSRARTYLNSCATRWASHVWPDNVRHAGMRAMAEKIVP